jgi:nucleoid-associated protein YgaU
MKRDVKVGLLVAAVVCGVAAILLGGGLVGEDHAPAPALQVSDAAASGFVDPLSADMSVSIAPPPELDSAAAPVDELVALSAIEAPPATAVAAAQSTGRFVAPGSLPFLRIHEEVVLPGANAPDALPRVAVAENPSAWRAAAPSVGGAAPAEPVNVAVPEETDGQDDDAPWRTAVATSRRVTSDTGIAPPAGTVSAPAAPTHHYVVQAGDSFFAISKKLYDTVRYFPDLQKANPDIDPRRMRAGMRIAVPDIAGASPREGLLVAVADRAPRSQTVFLAQDKVHVVQPGEMLESISYAYYGKRQKWSHIVRANPGLDPGTIRPGMRIVIPALTE